MTLGVFDGFLGHIQQVFYALIPLIAVALISHFFLSRMTREEVRRTAVGFIMTLVGLALFLQGVVVGFEPVGKFIGETIGKGNWAWTLIPLGLLFGTIAALAEPSVIVMAHTVDRVSAGSIPPRLFLPATAAAVGVAVAVAMARVLWGIPLLWILIPGYAIAFILSLIGPRRSSESPSMRAGTTGPVTSTFILAISLGAAGVIAGRSPVIESSAWWPLFSCSRSYRSQPSALYSPGGKAGSRWTGKLAVRRRGVTTAGLGRRPPAREEAWGHSTRRGTAARRRREQVSAMMVADPKRLDAVATPTSVVVAGLR